MSKETIWLIVWVVLVGAAFGWLWRGGYLLRFADYVKQTREELRKCTWPSWDELKGSTVVIGISIVLIGSFTVGVDALFWLVFSRI
jgi:preprotein translocase subunit SecE